MPSAPRFLAAVLLVPLACSSSGDEGASSAFSASGTFGPATTSAGTSASTSNNTQASETQDTTDSDPTTGDGDGDPTTGDGDGDPTTGDGDGDPTTGMMEPDLPQGGSLGINELAPGDLVITEIMYNPNACADQDCEWIEVYNASGSEVDLDGLRIQDINLDQTGIVSGQLLIAAGGYVWIGKDAAGWTYDTPADAYHGTNPAFNNSGSDQAVILNDFEVLDASASYTANDAGVGVSWQLSAGSLDAVQNDNPGAWCYSSGAFSGGDLGSPKAPNDPC